MKITYLNNGQWTLAKSATAAPKLAEPHNMPAIHNEVGKTHTVEIHPDIDHLYNVKNFAQQDPRGKVKVMDIKKHPDLKHMANKVPRDANGWVTPEGIDKHIEGLPKKKVNVKVLPFNMRAQQHRDLPGDRMQYVASMELHPDTLKNMKPEERETWNNFRHQQHEFSNGPSSQPEHRSGENQFGWARIDPWKRKPNPEYDAEKLKYGKNHSNPRTSAKSVEPNHGHWHMDEIQSDFQNKDRLKPLNTTARAKHEVNRDMDADRNHPLHSLRQAVLDASDKWDKSQMGPEAYGANEGDDEGGVARHKRIQEHPDHKALNEARNEHDKKRDELINEKSAHFNKEKQADPKVMHEHLSHGHEDPQHAIHSAVNALGRKMGVTSTSMDTPKDQAEQSNLKTHEDDEGDREEEMMDHLADLHPNSWRHELEKLKSGKHHANDNPYFKTAIEKIGGLDNLTKLANRSTGTGSGVDLGSNADAADDHDGHSFESGRYVPGKLAAAVEKLSGPESDALEGVLHDYNNNLRDYIDDNLMDQNDDGTPAEAELPVHQQLTYGKRPAKLGYKTKDKAEVLGDDPNDKQKEVQYNKLHKKLTLWRSLLKGNNG